MLISAMIKWVLTLLLVLFAGFVSAQATHVDDLQRQLAAAKEDTAKAYLLECLSKHYVNIQPDSVFYYAQQLVKLSQKLNYHYGEAIGFYFLSAALDREGNYSKALEMAYRCLHIAESLKKNRNYVTSLAYFQKGLLNRLTKDDRNALINLRHAVQLAEQSEIANSYLYHFYSHLAAAYNAINKYDSAFLYAHKGYKDVPENRTHVPFSLITFARIHEKLKDDKRAKDYLLLAIKKGKEYNSLFHMAIAENSLAALYKKTGRLDSCIYYAGEALAFSVSNRNALYAMSSSSLLSQAYETKNNTDSTLKYMKMMLAIKDSMFSQAKMQEYQLIAFEEQQRQQQAKAREERYRNQIKLYALLAALVVFLLIAVILYRNNQQKQKAKRKIEQAYEQLKAMQAQLIQREKMASLGEVTAGIAHEIQNPLNFVNNFSDVSRELVDEMGEALQKDDKEEAITIAEDIKDNLEKINHHGRRADAIVKGMLEHSRSSKGEKQPTDINALADEYLRLAYHGTYAKDKDFNLNIITNFDEGIGEIEVTPQDIGRVLLNLYNNAFYAVNEKKKQLNGTYEPIVEVSTKRVGNKIQLSVKDNGSGIPQKVLEKIYQPFFTTKPTGQGTGLGLSLSYDIVTQGHGGEMRVETKEGEYAEFVITLPIQQRKEDAETVPIQLRKM